MLPSGFLSGQHFRQLNISRNEDNLHRSPQFDAGSFVDLSSAHFHNLLQQYQVESLGIVGVKPFKVVLALLQEKKIETIAVNKVLFSPIGDNLEKMNKHDIFVHCCFRSFMEA